MSFTLKGSDSQIAKVGELALQIPKTATLFPYVETLPVDLPSIKGNRKTSASTIIKNLSSEGGYNPGLWRFPNVIKAPIEAGKIYIQKCLDEGWIKEGSFDHTIMMRGFINGAFYLRWDGDHRHKIWKGHYFPSRINDIIDQFEENGSYDCMVYEIDDVSKANELFVKIQKLLQKSLTPDDGWCNTYLSGDGLAHHQAENMRSCGVGVKDSNGEIWPTQAFDEELWISSRLFNDYVHMYGRDNVQRAIRDISEILKNKPKWSKEVYATAYGGLAVLYKKRPEASKNGLNTKIKEMLSDSAKLSKKDFIEVFKAKGGNQHNKECESFAYGVAKLFKNAVNEGVYGDNLNQANPLKIKSLFDDLGLKGDNDAR
tara:strand:- start:33 stop:1145 length:1113 start_codon:yes stop_codon:yes gene_type:complete